MTKKRHQNIPASYLTLIKDSKILLLRRCNTGYEDENYSMIAGHVDPGETFTQCIIREAEEEAGILLKPEDLQVVHVMHRNSGTTENNERVDIFFIVNMDGSERNAKATLRSRSTAFRSGHITPSMRKKARLAFFPNSLPLMLQRTSHTRIRYTQFKKYFSFGLRIF